jgi:putative ABC transport system ATP-binding protein
LLARLNREFGKTVVMVTHDPRAASFATEVRHLEKGELIPQRSGGGDPQVVR